MRFYRQYVELVKASVGAGYITPVLARVLLFWMHVAICTAIVEIGFLIYLVIR